MGSKTQHLAKHKNNKKLANSDELSKIENFDWKIIMIYYAALHLLDSTYAEDDEMPHPPVHTYRKAKIKSKHNDITFRCYKNLERLSRQARYDCITMKQKHVDKANGYLATIETVALALA
ncbi:MAG: hypothetical protein ACRCX2_11755 [Paraclostridium sp.]